MALFTDGQLNNAIDLQNYENRILDVASAEGIDVAGKIALAQDEIANELTMYLLKRQPVVELQWLSQPVVRQKVGVSDVVATAPLRQWHAHKTLAFIYRDAYNNQLNDRYQGKWNEYEQLAKTSSQNYFRIGVGLVAGPIPKANTPALSMVAGNGAPSTYYVAVTWVNQGGVAGSPSEIGQATTSSGQQLAVAAMNPPDDVIGWNVYVGQSPDLISQQNATPIGLGNTWVLTEPLIQGARPGGGQAPSWYLVDHRAIGRG